MSDVNDPEQGISFDDLPEPWQRKYAGDPALGVWEYENACREDRRRGESGPSMGVSIRPSFFSGNGTGGLL